jgi:hypothetical protein
MHISSCQIKPTIMHNFHKLYVYWCHHIRVNKSRRMRWVGHVARMGETRGAYKILVVRPDHLGDPGIDGRII